MENVFFLLYYAHILKKNNKSQIILIGNPLKCDCELRWYKQWINDEWNEVEETWLKKTICTNPRDGKQHYISEVDLKDMFCDASVQDKAPKVGYS